MSTSKVVNQRLQKRTIATVFDIILCFALALYLATLFHEEIYLIYYQAINADAPAEEIKKALNANRLGNNISWIPFFTAIFFAYNWAFETSPMRATFGKYLFGLYWSSPEDRYWLWVKRAALKTLIFSGPLLIFQMSNILLAFFFMLFVFGGNYLYALKRTEENSQEGQQLSVYDKYFNTFLQERSKSKKAA
ncbi:RDD family protein [Saprospira sp. CCB-QB6]|uniref:RDD family protein n=1 Tax=Saprospira sp. CCB-QB6 TaxID=3023936 RepID=UPI00234A7CE9|nr:RDD family protein [Saprospira sp. CCB-QB6]WCL81271.1 RDD family protein [Saprospira sp. CCB-QB6]